MIDTRVLVAIFIVASILMGTAALVARGAPIAPTQENNVIDRCGIGGSKCYGQKG